MKRLLVIIFFILLSLESSFANISSIKYVDIDFLINNSEAGKNVLTTLKKKRDKDSKKLVDFKKKLQKINSELLNKKNVLSETDFKKEIALFKSEINEFNKEKQKLEKELAKLRNELYKLIIKEVRIILLDFSKENSIKLVVDKKSVIIGETNLDVTKEILDLLNKKIKKVK